MITINNASSPANNDSSIEMININYARQHLLYIAYLGTLSVVGIIANSIIIIVYLLKRKSSAHTTITISLAMADMSVCFAIIPFEIIEKCFHFSLLTDISCKVWVTSGYFVVISSAFIIIVLSVDRHRRVCYPFKVQFTPKVAAIYVFIACVAAFSISIPNAFIWTIHSFNLDWNITGQVCVTEISENSMYFPTVYNCIILIVSVAVVIYFVIVYSFIWRTLLSHIRYVKRFKPKTRQEKIRNKSISVEEHRASWKITKVAFIVVIVFVLSYIPSTIMRILDTEQKWDVNDEDTIDDFLHMLARSSTYLNHIANVFIYMFIDIKFRRDCTDIIRAVFGFKKAEDKAVENCITKF